MKILTSIIIALYATSSVVGQTTGGTVLMADTTVAIEDVVCVGEKMRYLTPSQTLKGAQLESLSTTSVADALKYFSGVQIKDFGGLGGLKTVNVRSLGSQHVGVYLDGVRITNAQNGQVDLGKYSLSNMESVSLCNANKSERLQSATEYSSGATVYMQTRTPDKSGAEVEYGHGSFGLNKAKAYLSVKDHAFIDGEWQHTDGDYKFSFHSAYEDTTGRRNNGDITFYRIEAAGMWSGLRAHAYYYNSERGLPGPVVRRLSEQYDSKDRQWDQNLFAQLTWRGQWGGTDIKINGKYAFDYLHYLQDPTKNAAVMYVNNRYTQQDIYASLSAARNFWSWLSVTAGADVRWSDLNCNVYNFSYVYRIDTKAVVSAIAEWRGAECNVALLYTDIEDHTHGEAKPLRKWTPMFTTSYKHGAWVWRAFHKRIFRAPTLNDLYYTLVGNSSLKPEYATQWDIGADYRGEHLHVAIDAYHNKIENKIVAVPARFQFRWSMMNFGKVKSDGVSLSAGYDRAWGDIEMRTSVNYTWQRDLDRTDKDEPEYGNFIPYSPQHSGSVIGDVSYKGYSLSCSFLYTGERYCLVSNNKKDLLEQWETVDMKVNKSFDIKRVGLQVTAECNNITDSRHEVVKRYPMPSRNWKISLKLKI